jgi:hypothetical protein
LHTTFLELLVLAVLILVMVISIYLLRRSKRQPLAARTVVSVQIERRAETLDQEGDGTGRTAGAGEAGLADEVPRDRFLAACR